MLTIALGLHAARPAISQTVSPIDAIAAQIDGYDASLKAVGRASSDIRLDDAALQAQVAQIPPIDRALDAIVANLAGRTAAIDARLTELGPAPVKGQPAEAGEITVERQRLITVRQAIDTEAKQARVLTVVTDQLTTRLSDRRRALFSARLWTRGNSILDPRLWSDFLYRTPQDLWRLGTLQRNQRQRLQSISPGPGGWGAILSAIAVAILIIVPGHRWLLRLGIHLAERVGVETRLRRTFFALWTVVATTGCPLVASLLIRDALTIDPLLTPPIAAALAVLIRSIGFAGFLYGLGYALLSAARPSWRLAPLSDHLVERLARFPFLIAFTVWLANMVSGLNSALGISLSTSIVTDALTLLLELTVIGNALLIVARQRDAGEKPASDKARRSQLPWVIAALLSWMTVIWAMGAALIGYLALATFLVREMVWIVTILASLFLLVRLGDDLAPAILGGQSRSGRFVGSVLGLSESAQNQIAILAAGIARLGWFLLAWAAALAPFGATASGVLSGFNTDDLIFRLGPVSISPGTILGGALLFALGLILTRAVRGWLEKEYLPSTTLDIGVRTSLAAAVTYVGAFVAVLIGSTYLGLSLDRIALLASALSVGIGFGLQPVIGNFVSGLILLAERPVKVGDWIAVGDLEGDVKRINVRATEIEMADRSRLIVPNSELVTKTVRNVTHGEALGRIRIVLTVNDDSDVLAIRQLLTGHLIDHPSVLDEPKPQVYFSDARDGGLEFTCFAYVASPRQTFSVRSDLLFEMIPDLKAKGFALSNSTPIVQVGLGDRAIEPDDLGRQPPIRS